MKRRTAVIAAILGAAAAFGLGHASASWREGWHGRAIGPGAYHGVWRHGLGACGDGAAEHLAAVARHAERDLGVTDAQRPAWEGLVAAVRDGGAAVAAACDGAPARPADTLPGALDRAEAALAAGLDAMRAVRPAAQAFYAVLDEEQRATLDGWLRRRHGGRP